MTTTSTPAPSAHDTGAHAAAAPAIAASSANNLSAGWEQAKALYRSATEREAAAQTALGGAEQIAAEFYGPGPQRQITYTMTLGRIGNTVIEPFETTRTLTLRDYDEPSDEFITHPDYRAYREEVREWKERREANLRQSGFREREAECDAAFDCRFAAWLAVVSYPFATLAELVDKLDVASSYADVPEDQEALLEGVAADVRRLAGEA